MQLLGMFLQAKKYPDVSARVLSLFG